MIPYTNTHWLKVPSPNTSLHTPFSLTHTLHTHTHTHTHTHARAHTRTRTHTHTHTHSKCHLLKWILISSSQKQEDTTTTFHVYLSIVDCCTYSWNVYLGDTLTQGSVHFKGYCFGTLMLLWRKPKDSFRWASWFPCNRSDPAWAVEQGPRIICW